MNLNIQGLRNSFEIEMLVKAFYPWENIDKTEAIKEVGTSLKIVVKESLTIIYYLDGLIMEEICDEIGNVIDEKELRQRIKRGVYSVLSRQTKQELPWGILTGIRPTKIVVAWLNQGLTRDEIMSRLNKRYLVSIDKGQLMLDVATEELKILRAYNEEDYSLYIGIPFCPSKCLYCSFTSYSIEQWASSVGKYLQALEKEIKYVAMKYAHKRLRTIYIGGGTPTSISAAELKTLFTMISEAFDLSYIDEWTVEAGRPDSITLEKLKVIKAHGITRISINPQTMHQKTLDLIGREHSVEQVVETFRKARDLGFDNINMDMILGLPDEGRLEIQKTLAAIEALNPESLTVHALAIKRRSILGKNPEKYRETFQKDVLYIEKDITATANRLELIPYYLYRQKNMVGNLENIGYARKGKACLYNVLMMEEQQTILAVGAGAVSKIVYPKENRIERIENVKNVTDYIERIETMLQRKSFL